MNLEKTQERFIKDVYQNVAFYSRKAEENNVNIGMLDLQKDWHKIPLLKKQELSVAGEGIIMPDCIPLWLSEQLPAVYTSGSSGICLKVFWRLSDVIKSLLPLWLYRKKDYGVSPQDKYCYFYSSRTFGREDCEIEILKNQMGFSKNNLTEQRMIEIYQKMQEYDPVWLSLQPSIAMLLCDVKRKYDFPEFSSLRYIEMSGEMLTTHMKKRFQDAFQCRVVNQYGAYEVNSIAYECKNGNLHCMEQNVILEILDQDGNEVPDGTEGDIYITSLQNRTMPFIRYKIGDRGYLCKGVCSCGRTGRVLCLTEGRVTDWIITRERRKINPYVLMRPIENINRMLEEPVMQFQVVQEDYDEFTYRLVAEKEVQYEIERLIFENICEEELSGCRVNIEFCDCILPDESGKVRWFLRKGWIK